MLIKNQADLDAFKKMYGKMEIYLQTDAMEQQGIIFQSADNGVTWEYAGCKE